MVFSHSNINYYLKFGPDLIREAITLKRKKSMIIPKYKFNNFKVIIIIIITTIIKLNKNRNAARQ